jgi:hypothetical protein
MRPRRWLWHSQGPIKGITVRKSHRGSILAVRSLFILVRLPVIGYEPRPKPPGRLSRFSCDSSTWYGNADAIPVNWLVSLVY